METWCGVIYREWRSDGYPKHTRTMHSYAFKPLIIYVSRSEVVPVHITEATLVEQNK